MDLPEYLATHPKKHLIFDFDETLFSLELPWEIYVQQLSEKLMRLDPTLKSFTHHKSLNEVENEAVRRLGVEASQRRKDYSAYFETTYLTGVVEHKDLTNFIRANHTKYHCYIWSSNMKTTIQPILEKERMVSFFKKIITKTDVSLTKPDPEGFGMIFNQKTQDKKEYLMIGDSINDKGAASNAGIDFFLVKNNESS